MARYNKIEFFLMLLSFEVVYHIEIGSWNKVLQSERLGRKKKDLKE